MRLLGLVMVLIGCSCSRYDERVVSPDGRFAMELKGSQLTKSMVLRSLEPTGGWAELLTKNGESCGRGHPAYPSQLPLRDSDIASTSARFRITWDDVVRVEGIEGYWTIAPCRFVEAPSHPY